MEFNRLEGSNVYVCLDQRFPPAKKREFWRNIYLGFAANMYDLQREHNACWAQVNRALNPLGEPVPIFILLLEGDSRCANITQDTPDQYITTIQNNVLKDHGYIAVGQCLNLRIAGVEDSITASAAGCPK
jgi:hypothetical protein